MNCKKSKNLTVQFFLGLDLTKTNKKSFDNKIEIKKFQTSELYCIVFTKKEIFKSFYFNDHCDDHF